MLPLDDIFRHCKGIAQLSEPNVLCPVYHLGTPTLQDKQSMRQVLPPQYPIFMRIRWEDVP